MIRQLAIELAPHDIRVLGVAPTFCDVGRVALFCASDMSIFMTGSTLLADAGETS